MGWDAGDKCWTFEEVSVSRPVEVIEATVKKVQSVGGRVLVTVTSEGGVEFARYPSAIFDSKDKAKIAWCTLLLGHARDIEQERFKAFEKAQYERKQLEREIIALGGKP